MVTEDRIKDTIYYNDSQANNYIGSLSLLENLKQVKVPVIVNKLTENNKRKLFYNLGEVLSENRKAKIWYLIKRRYDYARTLRYIEER